MKQNDGFTAVELLVSLFISSILLTAIGFIISFGMEHMNKTSTLVDLQYEGQIAMNQIKDVFLKSNKFENVKMYLPDGTEDSKVYNGANIRNIKDEISVRYMDIKFIDTYSSGTHKEKTFRIDCYVKHGVGVVEGRVSYDSSSGWYTGHTYEMGRYIKSFKLKPIDSNMYEAKLYEITLVMEKDGKEIELKDQIKCRNKKTKP